MVNGNEYESHKEQFMQHVRLPGRYFDNLRPPEFSGTQSDFELWTYRFTWHATTKSPLITKMIARRRFHILAIHHHLKNTCQNKLNKTTKTKTSMNSEEKYLKET